MKKLLSVLFICAIAGIAKSQITLEHTYPNAAFYMPSNTQMSLSIINLGDSVYNYLYIDKANSRFSLYNMNHSLNVSDTFPFKCNYNGGSVQIMYFSRSLFDCNTSNIEYMIWYQKSTSQPQLKYYSNVSIYRTNGTRLYFWDSAALTNSGSTIALNKSPITKTPNGSKLMIDKKNGDVEVYSLCGILPTGYGIMNEPSENILSAAYPNPAMSYTRIDYTLPENVGFGEIVFYDSKGSEVKRFKVDHNFTNLQLNTNDLKAGTYYYNLLIQGKLTEGKKLVVIK